MNPCSKDGGMVQCCIRRNKGTKATLGLGLFPEYRCYLRGTNNSRTETFLMTAKKRAANKTSNYLISMGRNDHDKDSKNILGKLRGNFFDTEYILYDHGKNPEDCSQEGKNDGGCARIELSAILYAPSSSLRSKGPRTISVGISNVDKEGSPVKVWQPLHKRDDSMLDCLKKIDEDQMSSKEQKHLVHLQSKPPAWDEAMQRFFLNFNGRVTMASVKNFQLVDDKGDMSLQFGRTGKDEFILDVQWPLSPFQAFALALSSFDSKVGCD
jgi:tubby-related protein 1